MSTIEIVLAVISSSVFSALLTSIVNWRLHNSNYKKEYYKKILEKRLAAFEIVQSISRKMSIQVQLDNFVTPQICFDEDAHMHFILLLGKGIDNSFWLDNETSRKLTEINVYLLNNVSNKISEDLSTEVRNEAYQNLGFSNAEQIKKFRIELDNLTRKELLKLDNVLYFFKRKTLKEDKVFPIYRKEV